MRTLAVAIAGSAVSPSVTIPLALGDILRLASYHALYVVVEDPKGPAGRAAASIKVDRVASDRFAVLLIKLIPFNRGVGVAVQSVKEDPVAIVLLDSASDRNGEPAAFAIARTAFPIRDSAVPDDHPGAGLRAIIVDVDPDRRTIDPRALSTDARC